MQAYCTIDGGLGPFNSFTRVTNHAIAIDLSQPSSSRSLESHTSGDRHHDKQADNSRKNAGKRTVSHNGFSRDNGSKKVKPNSPSEHKFEVYYEQDSIEFKYAASAGVCLYCAKAGHRIRECPDKRDNKAPTPIRVPKDWTPNNRSNRQDSEAFKA